MLRRTVCRFNGGHIQHIPPVEEMEHADICRGILKAKYYNGNLKFMRLIDFKWWMNRMTALYREGIMAMMVMYPMVYYNFWGIPMMITFNDAAPPRHVDWNKGKAGFLPSNFQKTEVKI